MIDNVFVSSINGLGYTVELLKKGIQSGIELTHPQAKVALKNNLCTVRTGGDGSRTKGAILTTVSQLFQNMKHPSLPITYHVETVNSPN